MQEPRVPITLVTGFLGAGKSTLLNRIIAAPDAERCALIVNEFGEIGLDHDLIDSSAEEPVLLASGCICCSLRGDLAQTIADLLARRKAGDLAFDRIVIETTGLADPGPIKQVIYADPYLTRHTHLDGVVTLVDAVHGVSTLDQHFEAVSQVCAADLVLLTKTDLPEAEDPASLRARITLLNPTAPVRTTTPNGGDFGPIWGLSAIRRGAKTANVLDWLSPAATKQDPLGNLTGLQTAAQKPALNPMHADIGTASIAIKDPLSDVVFDNWLNGLVRQSGPDLLRAKGIVFLKGIEKPFVFHGVQNVFDELVQLRDWPTSDTTSRVVVIMRNMSNAQLAENMKALQQGA